MGKIKARKNKKKKEYRPPSEAELIEKYGSATTYSCIPCERSGILSIMDIGIKNFRNWTMNRLTLTCAECQHIAAYFDYKDQPLWGSVHLPSQQKRIKREIAAGKYHHHREPEDWDGEILVNYNQDWTFWSKRKHRKEVRNR